MADSKQIFIIEDDPAMASCLAIAAAPYDTSIFRDGVSAMAALDHHIPNLILLDIMLVGPDGFTLLNELISYNDTMHIPIIIVSSLNLADQDLSHYGVVAILNKETMTPTIIREEISRAI